MVERDRQIETLLAQVEADKVNCFTCKTFHNDCVLTSVVEESSENKEHSLDR